MTAKHVKRSPAFQQKIEKLIKGLLVQADWARSDQRLDEATLFTEAVEILAKHTTDAACLVKAADDEPIFVLRGHDVTAGGPPWPGELPASGRMGVVDFWCELQIERRVATRDTSPAEKIADARDCAREMRAYPNRKFPD